MDATHERAFACARGGLADTLRSSLLGGYDGSGAWVIEWANIRAADEHDLVEIHEGLHHELQASSSWGRIAAMAALLADRGVRRYALRDVFYAMVEASRETHERFATVLSASGVGLGRARELLAGNRTYLGYLDRALAMVGVDDAPWQLRETAAAAVLRCCMAPAAVADLLARGFGELHDGALDIAADGPDQRLLAFECAGGPGGWDEMFADVRARHPDRGGDLGGPEARGFPRGVDAVERLRRFEEEVLLRGCYEYAASVLSSAGHASVAWSEQLALAESLKAAVYEADKDLGGNLQVLTKRRPIMDDGLEYDRQGIRLRARLPVELVDADETLRLREAFEFVDADGSRYAAALWLSRPAAVKQFAFPADLSLPDPVCALIVPARTADGSEVVRLGLLPAAVTPTQCQDALGGLPLVVLSSHVTLTDLTVQQALSAVEPVFVLMDLPAAWHVGGWIRQGGTVQLGLVPLAGNGMSELWMAVLAVDLAPRFRFFSIGGRNATAVLVEQLRQRHPSGLSLDGGLPIAQENLTALNIAVDVVLASWHVLDQEAA